jgi:hypothetical protein
VLLLSLLYNRILILISFLLIVINFKVLPQYQTSYKDAAQINVNKIRLPFNKSGVFGEVSVDGFLMGYYGGMPFLFFLVVVFS